MTTRTHTRITPGPSVTPKAGRGRPGRRPSGPALLTATAAAQARASLQSGFLLTAVSDKRGLGAEAVAFLRACRDQWGGASAVDGLRDAQQGRVHLGPPADGAVSAQVRDDAGVHTTALVTLVPEEIWAACSCPDGCQPKSWCRHAVAVAYVAADVLDAAGHAATATPTPTPAPAPPSVPGTRVASTPDEPIPDVPPIETVASDHARTVAAILASYVPLELGPLVGALRVALALPAELGTSEAIRVLEAAVGTHPARRDMGRA